MTHPVHERIEQLASGYAQQRETVFDVRVTIEGEHATVAGAVLEAKQRAEVLAMIEESLPDGAISDRLAVLVEGEQYGWATVAWSVADVRSRPGHNTELVTQASYGEAVELLRREGDWWHVRQRDGYLGWMSAFGLVESPSTSALAFRETATHQINTRWQPVYGLEGDQLSLLPWGVLLPVLEFRDAQAFFISPDGRPCSLAADSLIPVADRPDCAAAGCAEIVDAIRQFVGVPYLWGGTTAFGFDCSGLAQTTYRFLGRLLPRDADQQSKVGRPVEPSQLQAGDLLFWSGKASEAGRHNHIDHVAIALDGETIIHANQRRWAVSVDSIAELQGRYEERGGKGLVCVRRIAEEGGR